jgi:hypothetical protein
MGKSFGRKIEFSLKPRDLSARFTILYYNSAGHSGRAACGMKCLRPFEHWDRGFESHSRRGCLCLFCVYVR